MSLSTPTMAMPSAWRRLHVSEPMRPHDPVMRAIFMGGAMLRFPIDAAKKFSKRSACRMTRDLNPSKPLSLLSVVIPARDEEGSVGTTVEHLHAALQERGIA